MKCQLVDYLRFRFGVRKFCCDGVCCEPDRVRRDGVTGSRPGVLDPVLSTRDRFDGVPFSFGVDILLHVFFFSSVQYSIFHTKFILLNSKSARNLNKINLTIK